MHKSQQCLRTRYNKLLKVGIWASDNLGCFFYLLKPLGLGHHVWLLLYSLEV